MKWIKYQIVQSTIGKEDILINKKVGYSNENLAIAQREAYDGYEIIDDEQSFEKEPLAIEFGGTGAKTAEDARAKLGAAPAGFGLGTYASWDHFVKHTNMNDIVENGWHVFNSGSNANAPFDTGVVLVINRGADNQYLFQIAFQDAGSGSLIQVRQKNAGTWRAWHAWHPTAFAPSGYGLGLAESTPYCEDVNNALVNGWYRVDANSKNGINAEAIIRVETHNYGWSGLQTAYAANYSSAFVAILQRSLISGKWGEWEWENPPMYPGVEYRTTERYITKPVYACFLDVGYIDKETTIPHSLSIETCVSIEFFNSVNNHTHDVGLEHLRADGTNIYYSAAWPAGSARFLLKYTKP